MSLCRNTDGDHLKIPLSVSQKRIWLLQNLYEDPVMYNTVMCFKVSGRLDVAALEMTLHKLANRQEVLKYRLGLSPDGLPYQTAEMNPRFTVEYADLCGESRQSVAAASERILREAVLRPFDLYGEKLIRVVVVRVNESEFLLLFVLHHLLADYAGRGIFLSEFAQIYDGIIDGKPAVLPPLAWQYAAFAAAEAISLSPEITADQSGYWRDFFSGGSPVHPAGGGIAKGVRKTGSPEYETLTQVISPETVKGCRSVAESSHNTLFTIYLTAIALLTRALYGHPEVMLCTANGNRRRPGSDSVMGCFFTNVVLSIKINPADTIAALLHVVRELFVRERKRQELPFELFAGTLGLVSTKERRPPYPIYISYHAATHAVAFSLSGAKIQPAPCATGRNTREDIVFDIWEKKTANGLGLEIVWLWRNDVFDRHSIERAADLLSFLIGQIGEDPQRPVERLDEDYPDL